FVCHNSRWSFARACHHRQRPGNLAIPACERVQSRPAVAIAVAVVAAANDVQQPARGPAVGAVVDGEQPAERIEAARVRVPETGRPALEPGPVEPAAVETSPFAAPRKSRAIRADDLVINPGILAESEVDPA